MPTINLIYKARDIYNNDYKEVEYIQSSWTQWINTWITPTINTKSQIKFVNLEASWYSIYGFYNNDDNRDYRLFNYNSSRLYFDIWGSRSIWVSEILSQNVLYEFELWNRYVKDLVWWRTIVSWSTVSSFTANWTITLNGNANCSKNKWYYVKIYENWTMVRNLVPCYRKRDSVIWMYDIVNNVFYTNSWTWTFIKWPDIN